MNRHDFEATQQASTGHGDQNRIGLRAVAAAIRYQGANNAERSLARAPSATTAAMTPTEDRDA